jgi:hypothetical protein
MSTYDAPAATTELTVVRRDADLRVALRRQI